MLEIRRGRVQKVAALDENTSELVVLVGEEERRALCFRQLTRPAAEGDEVLLNTTAVALGLGTGGVDFVSAVLREEDAHTSPGEGHIMKVRYTPSQTSVLSAEERNPELYADAGSLEKMPVVATALHSQVAAVAAGVKAECPNARVAYLMTDAAALPLGLSNLVRDLKAAGLVDVTITCGQAFGGDFEAINLYSGLLVAKREAGADVVIAGQGPGNAGTGTALGFSGLEVGQIVNAAHSLDGRPVVSLRMSLADARERHRVISHHSLTALARVALAAAMVVLPEWECEDEIQQAVAQLEALKLFEYHEIRTFSGSGGVDLLRRKGIGVKSMGRTMDEDPIFFHAASAAGKAAGRMLDPKFAG